jgi:hypothetical protein
MNKIVQPTISQLTQLKRAHDSSAAPWWYLILTGFAYGAYSFPDDLYTLLWFAPKELPDAIWVLSKWVMIPSVGGLFLRALKQRKDES